MKPEIPKYQKAGHALTIVGLIFAFYGTFANQENTVEAGYRMLVANVIGLCCLIAGIVMVMKGRRKS
jgi:peptidoglycan/LPS O-acetylase OafA/YrhL